MNDELRRAAEICGALEVSALVITGDTAPRPAAQSQESDYPLLHKPAGRVRALSLTL